MKSSVLRVFAVFVICFIYFFNPTPAEAGINYFPMDNMVNLLNIRFEGSTLKQIYLRNPGQARFAVQCKTSRVVTNFPPKLGGDVTIVVGQVVWFDALYFVSESITSNRPIFVRNDIQCILASNINLFQFWINNFRYLPKPPFQNPIWADNPNSIGFVYYVSFGDPSISERWPYYNWCRARSVGNVNTNKIYYNAVFMLNDINSYYLTYTSIDIYCTNDIRAVNIWLRNGWVRYRYS